MPVSIPRLLAAATAGLAATVPMSLVMILWHRLLPSRERGPLPPAKITHQALQSVGLADDLSPQEITAATVASHFGYGAASGAAYGLISTRLRAGVPSATAGAAFGLGVWVASYLGWLPAVGWHRSALNEPPRRNLLMIAAHVVYGASLGLLTEVFSPSRREELQVQQMGLASSAHGSPPISTTNFAVKPLWSSSTR